MGTNESFSIWQYVLFGSVNCGTTSLHVNKHFKYLSPIGEIYATIPGRTLTPLLLVFLKARTNGYLSTDVRQRIK